MFQKSDIADDVRRAVIAKKNSMFYRIKNNEIEIVSFFANRKNPQILDM